jgi:hypothetical protein
MKRLALALAVMLTSCTSYKPPEPPSPRDGTRVNASMGRTWDAVIDLFAERNIPIRTIERVSGIIATDRLSVGSEGREYADCGKLNRIRLRPEMANYNVLVRGDSTSSTVKVTVLWTYLTDKGKNIDCSTTHVWEMGLEEKVKSYAQTSSLRASRQSPTSPSSRATAIIDPGASQAQAVTEPDAPPPPKPRSVSSKAPGVPQPQQAAPQLRTNTELLTYVAFRLPARSRRARDRHGHHPRSHPWRLALAGSEGCRCPMASTRALP